MENGFLFLSFSLTKTCQLALAIQRGNKRKNMKNALFRLGFHAMELSLVASNTH